jgi:hypothetical protein
MPKTNSVPLPPLSLKALAELDLIERPSSSALQSCVNEFGVLVNKEKATRTLRTCVVEVFDAQLRHYESLQSYRQEWVHEIARATIETVLGLVPTFVNKEAFRSEVTRTLQEHWSQRQQKAISIAQEKEQRADRKKLRDAYFAHFQSEPIKILDICWAVGQHYREWKRWLNYELKDGSTPDLAFRKILTSAQRPQEFNKKPRPAKWQ